MSNYTFTQAQAAEATMILSRIIEDVVKDDEYRIVSSTLRSAEAVATAGSNMIKLTLSGNQLRWVRDIVSRVSTTPEFVRVFNDVLGVATPIPVTPVDEYISVEEYAKEWVADDSTNEQANPVVLDDEKLAKIREMLEQKTREQRRIKFEKAIEQIEADVASLRLEARRKLYEAKKLKKQLNN